MQASKRLVPSLGNHVEIEKDSGHEPEAGGLPPSGERMAKVTQFLIRSSFQGGLDGIKLGSTTSAFGDYYDDGIADL